MGEEAGKSEVDPGVKVAAYALYWLLAAPIIFVLTIRLVLVLPELFVMAIWGESAPAAVEIGLLVLVILGIGAGSAAVFWLWPKYQDILRRNFGGG